MTLSCQAKSSYLTAPVTAVQLSSTAPAAATALRTGLACAKVVESGVEVGVNVAAICVDAVGVGVGVDDCDCVAATVALAYSDHSLVALLASTARTAYQ